MAFSPVIHYERGRRLSSPEHLRSCGPNNSREKTGAVLGMNTLPEFGRANAMGILCSADIHSQERVVAGHPEAKSPKTTRRGE